MKHINFVGYTVELDSNLQLPVRKARDEICAMCEERAEYAVDTPVGYEHMHDVPYCYEHMHEAVYEYGASDTWRRPDGTEVW